MPATADYSAIAKAILDQLSSQVGLATTLATAISGGLVALVIQVAIHNRSGGTTTPLVLNAQWLILAALLCEAISLLSGYFARGAITDVAPILMQLPADSWHPSTAMPHGASRFRDVVFPGSSQLSWMVTTQFFAMLIGLFMIFAFAIVNRNSLLGK